MKLSGYIIEKYNKMDGAYTCHRLVEEAKALGICLSIIGINDCFVIDSKIVNNQSLLLHRDFIINRYKYGKIKHLINDLATKSYNNIGSFENYVNKFVQIQRLRSNDFLIPKYILSCASPTLYDALSSTLQLPFVAKGLESSMGREIYLIRDKKDYLELAKHYPTEKEWLFEEFIESSFGRDLRLFSIRGKALACMKRTSETDFRANVALGASVDNVRIDDTLQRIAKDIYEQTQLDFIGIDLLFGREQYYLCEINVMPGLEGIEAASGINIAREIIKTIKNDF